jgi:hypothetical protein
MRNLFKNRILVGALIFWAIDFVQGFAVLSPILVYLRLKFEKSASVFQLWPLPSPDVLADIMINYKEILGFYFITAIVLMILFQLLKSLVTAGVYHFIIFRDNDQSGSNRTLAAFVQNSASNWTGFLKIDIFAIPVYLLAFFLGMIFGNFAANLGRFFEYIFLVLFFISASTYLQILRIQILNQDSNSLREAIKNTRPAIADSLLRILIGNISVALISFIIFYLFWILLKFTKSADWSIIIAVLTIIIQQLMILILCAAQALRVNYNFSVTRKGD